MWSVILSYISSSIPLSVPLMYGSTGEIITEKSGHLNLGIPGIMYVGSISGVIGAFLYEQACGNQLANMSPVLALLIPLQPILQAPSLQPAFDSVVPALFGAMAYQYFRGHMNMAVWPLVLMGVLFTLLPALVANTSMIVLPAGAAAFLAGYLLTKKA